MAEKVLSNPISFIVVGDFAGNVECRTDYGLGFTGCDDVRVTRTMEINLTPTQETAIKNWLINDLGLLVKIREHEEMV
jgi:hypothetical protein